MLLCAREDLVVDTEIGQEDLGSGIVNPIGGIVGMNMVRAPDLGAPTAKKLKITNPKKRGTQMKRYLCCFSKPKRCSEPEYVNGTPVEILSPLQSLFQPLPEDKEKLQALDFEIIEQINLLRAEANQRFQEGKSHIEKDELDRAIHYLRQTRAIEERIKTLTSRHTEIIDKLEIRVPRQISPHQSLTTRSLRPPASPRIHPLPSPKVPPTLN